MERWKSRWMVGAVVAAMISLAACDTTTGPDNPSAGGGSESDAVDPLISMVAISGGNLDVDPTDGSGDEWVRVNDFRIAHTEVTQQQYFEVMGSNPSRFVPEPYGGTGVGEAYADHPVDTVTWYEAIIFANRLSLRESLTPVYSIGGSTNPDDWGAPPVYDYEAGASVAASGGVLRGSFVLAEPVVDEESTPDGNPFESPADFSASPWNSPTVDWSANGYRLPTNVEWSWAAMGGANKPFAETSFSGMIAGGYADRDEYVLHAGNADTESNGNPLTGATASKRANALGLSDMSGNVWEWTWDWDTEWMEDISGTEVSPVADYRGRIPTGPSDSQVFPSGGYAARFVRGGSVVETPPGSGGGVFETHPFGSVEATLRMYAQPFENRRRTDANSVSFTAYPDDDTAIGFRLVRNAE
jgi:formylglycine-generating enzyme required for sulfatase activity